MHSTECGREVQYLGVFLLTKKTLRPNSIVKIIIKATGFFFLRKFQKLSIYTQQKVAEKCKILAIFFLLIVLCGIFCSFAVLCGPLRYLVRPDTTE